MKLGDVIGAAYNEWHEATHGGRRPMQFQVEGKTETIERFDVLLLCRMAEAGYTVGYVKERSLIEQATAVADEFGPDL